MAQGQIRPRFEVSLAQQKTILGSYETQQMFLPVSLPVQSRHGSVVVQHVISEQILSLLILPVDPVIIVVIAYIINVCITMINIARKCLPAQTFCQEMTPVPCSGISSMV